jgi:threonine synthase
MGFEIAEQLDWALPDVIVYPTGGGTGLVGMWKAFEELEKIGWISPKRPRMVSVQAKGCAPIVKAFQEGKKCVDAWEKASTIAAGLRVPKPLADFLILKALRESKGHAVAVNDNVIRQSIKEIAQEEGIFPCPEGAATVAGIKSLLDQKLVDHDEKIVLFNTGSGLKYLELFPLDLQTLNHKEQIDFNSL